MKKKTGQKEPDFDFEEGDILAKKYEILQSLGSGWEGEVYLIKEIETGIERAAKFFYPERNRYNQAIKYYAKKLHRLRHSDILIKYYTQESIEVKNSIIPFLVGEFVDGELLSDFIKTQPGGRLHPYQALHLLYALVKGVEQIHRLGEYHGDIHAENIIINGYGLNFDLKLVDISNRRSDSKPQNIQDDICDMIGIFYEAVGGKERYNSQDKIVKSICCGLRKNLILKKFRTSTKLKEYLENLVWS